MNKDDELNKAISWASAQPGGEGLKRGEDKDLSDAIDWASQQPGGEGLAHASERRGMGGTSPPAERLPPQDRPMSHEQLMAKAQAMLAEQQAKKAAYENPSLSQRDAAGNLLPAWLLKQGY